MAMISRRWIQASARTSLSASRPRIALRMSASMYLNRLVRANSCRRFFSSDTATATSRSTIQRPTNITKEERAALRAARKERAMRVLQAQQQQQQPGTAATTDLSTKTSTTRPNLVMSRWMWYLGVAVPTGLLVWGIRDENSPPAKFSRMIGLSSLIASFANEIAKPSHDKLLPDWSQMPNVPQNIPIPHTLVLDLENTLVSSSWDRKYGWRHAKRPGVDKFLRELAQYYEIVLYSPSMDGIADPVVTSLDKEGCIMHRLYRDATHYHNGMHVKDLDRLNRNVKRIIVVDDDPSEVQFHPNNLLRVKPYTDPTDRTDNTLARITPFLLEIAREGYDDIPALLSQYSGMDADEIADEQERRIQEIRLDRERRSHRGLAGLAVGGRQSLPTPELLPASADTSTTSSRAPQLTAKDIAGKAPAPEEPQEGLVGWMNRRTKEKEEHQMRKMEKWNEVMLAKQQKRREGEQQQQAGSS